MQKVTSDPTECPFAQAAVPIGPRHYNVWAIFHRDRSAADDTSLTVESASLTATTSMAFAL